MTQASVIFMGNAFFLKKKGSGISELPSFPIMNPERDLIAVTMSRRGRLRESGDESNDLSVGFRYGFAGF